MKRLLMLAVVLTALAAAGSARSAPRSLPVLIDWDRNGASDVRSVREDGRRIRDGLPCGDRTWRPSRRSPDGRRYSCVYMADPSGPDRPGRFRVAVAAPADRSRRTVYETEHGADQVFGDAHFSHDGNRVAFGVFLETSTTDRTRGHGAIAVVRGRGGRPRHIARTPTCEAGPSCLQIDVVGWTPRDRKLVYTRRDRTGARQVRTVNLRTGTDRALFRVIRDLGSVARVASLSPDGRLVAALMDNEHVRVYDIARRRWRATQPDAIAPQWFPDSRRIVIQNGGKIWAYNVVTKRRRRLPATSAGGAFAPDGRRYVAPGSDGADIYVHDLRGRRLRRLTRNATAVNWLAWGTVATREPTLGAGVAAPPPHWRPDVAAARHYLAHRGGSVSFAVRTERRLWGFHPFRTVPSASVLKAMLMVAYLNQRSVRDRPLRARDMRLLRPMIRRSDNASASLVRNQVGSAGLNRLARRVGMRRFTPVAHPWGLSRVNAADQTKFFLHIDRFVAPRHRRRALRLLASIVPSQRWGVARVAPRGWSLHFKGGWGSGSGAVDHQVALLTRGPLRVSIAVMTTGDGSHAYGKATLRGVFRRLMRNLRGVQSRRLG